MLTSRGLLSDSTCVLKAEPGKLDNKRSIYQFTHCFTLQTSNYDVIFDFTVEQRRSKSANYHDLIKAHAVR